MSDFDFPLPGFDGCHVPWKERRDVSLKFEALKLKATLEIFKFGFLRRRIFLLLLTKNKIGGRVVYGKCFPMGQAGGRHWIPMVDSTANTPTPKLEVPPIIWLNKTDSIKRTFSKLAESLKKHVWWPLTQQITSFLTLFDAKTPFIAQTGEIFQGSKWRTFHKGGVT